MAKSLRSKRKKRLRTLRREIAQPFYDNKETAKIAAQEAALNAPKVPVRSSNTTSVETSVPLAITNPNTDIDVEMTVTQSSGSSLKPVGGVGKKQKNKFKGKKDKHKRHCRGKIRKKYI
ncbi:uncharacterized protein LOC143892610 [Tasmannia lanceolata]|uniref:uncharacterized protein LOC143892610 n=1 Tax=Tasmannia lanceolata TaxID=3420 RepID=UPI0040628451